MKMGYRAWTGYAVVGLLLLGFGCQRGVKEDNGSAWLSAKIARRVDRQFGPAITNDPASERNGDGSHEGDNLLGRVHLQTVTETAQYLTERLLVPADPAGNVDKLSQDSALVGKLAAIAAATSLDSDPCREDTDNDGIPDVEEDLSQDPTGLCVGGQAVECRLHSDRSFTVKFSHCVAVTTAFTTLWTPQALTTYFTPRTFITHTTSSATFPVGRLFFFRLTNTTTNGTITAPTLGAYMGSEGCRGGTTLNMQSWFTPQLYRITGTTDQFQAVDLIYDGAVTLHYGQAGVDEQLFHVRYNRFTRLWGDADTGTTDNSRYLTLDGQALDYRVINSSGDPADGTTPFPDGLNNWVHRPDGMASEKYRVTFDPDGDAGPAPAGKYRVSRGMDNEDGRFFLDEANRVVSLKDKNGPDDADLLSAPWKDIDVDGVRVLRATATSFVFALNYYDVENPLGDGFLNNNFGSGCGKPFGDQRCRLEVEVWPFERLYSIVDADTEACSFFWDWTPTNPDYQAIPF